MPIHRTYQERGYCRRGGYQRLSDVLALCGEFYNAALQERRDAWRLQRVSVSLFDQQVEFTGVRQAFAEWAALDVGVGRGVLRRVDRGMVAFFRRVKAGDVPGFPRFKPRSRFRCIDLSAIRPGMLWRSADGRRAWVRVKGLPTIELRIKRALPPAEQLKALRIVMRGERLYVDLVFAEEIAPLEPSERTVGIDLGVNSRLALSDGTLIEGRRPDRRRERRLRRAVARSHRGSARRAKRVAMLSRETHRNQVRNRNAVHEITTALVRAYGRIAIEALEVRNMTRSAKGTVDEPGKQVTAKRALNRRILDQTWGGLVTQLTYKAEWAGRELVRVNPAYTSRTCSSCGVRTPQRHYRVHDCAECGTSLDRDINAARNVEARAFGAKPSMNGHMIGAGDAPCSAQSSLGDALRIVA